MQNKSSKITNGWRHSPAVQGLVPGTVMSESSREAGSNDGLGQEEEDALGVRSRFRGQSVS